MVHKFCSLRSGEETNWGRVDSGCDSYAQRSGDAMLWEKGIEENNSPTGFEGILVSFGV
jgi:hypothetical protein